MGGGVGVGGREGGYYVIDWIAWIVDSAEAPQEWIQEEKFSHYFATCFAFQDKTDKCLDSEDSVPSTPVLTRMTRVRSSLVLVSEVTSFHARALCPHAASCMRSFLWQELAGPPLARHVAQCGGWLFVSCGRFFLQADWTLFFTPLVLVVVCV